MPRGTDLRLLTVWWPTGVGLDGVTNTEATVREKELEVEVADLTEQLAAARSETKAARLEIKAARSEAKDSADRTAGELKKLRAELAEAVAQSSPLSPGDNVAGDARRATAGGDPDFDSDSGLIGFGTPVTEEAANAEWRNAVKKAMKEKGRAKAAAEVAAKGQVEMDLKTMNGVAGLVVSFRARGAWLGLANSTAWYLNSTF